MNNIIATCLATGLLAGAPLLGEEPDQTIAGLANAAEKFVSAFNSKDATAISELFTEDGEISDLMGQDLISGREAIKAHYEAIFEGDSVPGVAIEADSVRLIAPNAAIEDGTVHLTPAEEGAPPRSIAYSAVLIKDDQGIWKIGSTRDLSDVSGPAKGLYRLAKAINGDWTGFVGEVRLDLAIDWHSSGRFLSGEMLTTTPDGEPQTGTIRIGWNGATGSIRSWMFDDQGGARQSAWTATEEGWLLIGKGTTADGETIITSQSLNPDGDDALVWKSIYRIIDGEEVPGGELRLARRPPEPASN